MSQALSRPPLPSTSGAGSRPGHPLLAWLAVAILVAAAVFGSNTFSIRDRLLGSALPTPVAPVTSRLADRPAPAPVPAPTALRSTPWWQKVTTLEGTGRATALPVTVDRSAFGWRVTGSCAAGRLSVRSSGQEQPLVDAPCPEAVGTAGRTGPTSLDVAADGPWRLEIEQRIDTPLVEPPLAGMLAPGTTSVATGSFYKVDEVAAGKVSIYDQADLGYSVRLEDFWVTPSASLQLRLSTAESPRTTSDYVGSRSQLLAALDITAGSMNHTPPLGVDPTEFRSVVIWNPSDSTVYAAARLEPPT